MPKRRVRVFEQLKQSLEDALTFEKGRAVSLRVRAVRAAPKPMKAPQIKALRASLRVSQTDFAALLNVSPKAVQSWEQGSRRPRAATLKLLAIARKNPRSLLEA